MKPIFSLFAAVAVAWSLASVPAQAATFPAIGAGNAYAAYVTVNSTLGVKVVAGPIAPAGLGCNTASTTNTNRVLQIALGTALTSGTAVDTVTSTHSATNATVQSISTVQGVNALNGLVTASAVHAVANSAASGAGASSNGSGSSFLNLMILGIPVVANPRPTPTSPFPASARLYSTNKSSITQQRQPTSPST